MTNQFSITITDESTSDEDSSHGFTDTMYGQTLFHDSYPPERVLAMFGRIGFSPIISEYMNPPTPGRPPFRPIDNLGYIEKIIRSILAA